MEYLDLSGYEAAEDTVEGLHQPPHFAQATTSSMQDSSNGQFFNPTVQPGISCDVKPRLTKEQHDILESHYQKQPKPNTNIKKGFAETLNVSLEKVNNWFQNRRAKTKQDAKKAANAVSIYQAGQQSFNSDSESSPFQVSPQYAAMMQPWSSDGQATNGLGISHIQQQQRPNPLQTRVFQNGSSESLSNFSWPSQMLQDHTEYDLDSNRRTLTQEHFDAISRNGGMIDNYGQFESMQTGFSGDQDVWNQVFPNASGQDLKQQDLAFPYPVGAPLSSNDSTVPSSVSDHSVQFPTTNAVQSRANISAANSEWADSRSSSLSALQQDGTIPQMSAPHSQLPVTTSAQWQPGQSVPLDVDKLREGFRQAAQARSSTENTRHVYEQPLAFPSDEAYTRRNSQASALTHSMGSIGIGTPQSNQPAVFKSPAPPTNIAARRQRPRPAALGTASLRSQSHSGVLQPASPAYAQQQNHLTQDQQLRRIRSAIAVNGGVAQGRVMKSTPGSAQRSPLNWSFNDALNSPGLVRHISQGNLAPPTPQSPSEFPRQDLAHQYSAWHRSGQVRRQPSINETDLEHSGLPYQPSVSGPPQNFSSPPHTPMFYDHPFIAQPVGSNVITENTPPQSAPAGQTCFPSNIFATASQPPQLQSQLSMHHSMQVPVLSQPQQYTNTLLPEQQVQMPSVTFAPNQQANVTTGPPPGVPLQFANGVPVVSAEGTVKMSFPPQMHLLQQQSQQMQTPPQASYAFATSCTGSPNAQAMAQSSTQPRSELLVHEYSPPEAMKRAATPRKPIDTGPKNYVFTNAGPEHFEEKKGKKLDAKDSSASSSSPASSSGSASTS